jgi:hypothetical protein
VPLDAGQHRVEGLFYFGARDRCERGLSARAWSALALRPRSGSCDACAMQLGTQALDLVDQVKHHGHTLQIGFEVTLQAADASHTSEFFAAEAPCGVLDDWRQQSFLDQLADMGGLDAACCSEVCELECVFTGQADADRD